MVCHLSQVMVCIIVMLLLWEETTALNLTSWKQTSGLTELAIMNAMNPRMDTIRGVTVMAPVASTSLLMITLKPLMALVHSTRSTRMRNSTSKLISS